MYLELKDRTPAKFALISAISFTIASLLSLLFGLAGYLRFGGCLTGNVLTNYEWIETSERADAIVKISWLGVAFSTIASYPLVLNSTRIAFWEIFTKEGVYGASKISWALATAAFVIVTAVVGWQLKELDFFNACKGCTTTISLSGLFPGIMLYVVAQRARSGRGGLGWVTRGAEEEDGEDSSAAEDSAFVVADRRLVAEAERGLSEQDDEQERPDWTQGRWRPLGLSVITLAGFFILSGATIFTLGPKLLKILPGPPRPLEQKLRTVSPGGWDFSFADPTDANTEKNIKLAEMLAFITWDKAARPLADAPNSYAKMLARIRSAGEGKDSEARAKAMAKEARKSAKEGEAAAKPGSLSGKYVEVWDKWAKVFFQDDGAGPPAGGTTGAAGNTAGGTTEENK